MKFNPKIVTSYRSHGKWGDVIVCLLPVSWCINILSNSTTLLKLVEWQSEASIFTLRVRGKQWYWVYKTDLRDFNNFNKTPILFNKINGGFFNNFYKNADILLYKNNIYDSVFFNKKTKFYDILTESASYQDMEVFLKSSESIKNFKNNIKMNKFNIKEELLDIYSYIFDYKKYSKKNNNIQNTFSNRTSLSKNYLYFTNKNYYKNFKLNLNVLDLKRKYNYNKYYITTQKSIDGWLKENGVNYLNFFNYSDLNNYNSSNNLRLLRVGRIIVLPSDIFINVITNSFDVVHSWFIPGLGFKMDCVPGRSTHHTLYIDLPGIYYGQCAEICGRLHHHMPIRVCALMYEHFLLWYHSSSTGLFLVNNLRDSNLKKF